MTISVRFDDQLQRELAKAAKLEGLSKSEFIRRCVAEHLAGTSHDRLPWELGKDLFGRTGSGRSDLAREHKKVFREKLHGKKSHR